MVQETCGYLYPIDGDGLLFDSFEMQGCGHSFQGYGEIRVFHLTGQRVFNLSVNPFGAIYSKGVARNKRRRKKRKTLNMVPVRMGNKQVNNRQGFVFCY